MVLFALIKKDVNLKELFRGGAIAFVFKFLAIIANYLFLYFIARLYGAPGVGIFSTSWTLLILSSVIGKLGFDSAIVKFVAGLVSSGQSDRAYGVYRRSLGIVLMASSSLALLCFAVSGWLSEVFFATTNKQLFIQIVSLSIIPLSLMQFNAETMKGLKKITSFSVFQNGSLYLVSLLLLVVLYQFWQSIDMILIALGMSVLLLTLFSFILLNRQFRLISGPNPPQKQSSYSYRRILATTIPMLLTNIMFLLMNRTDILMLSAFQNEASVGIYEMALKIASLNTIALVAINSIATPKFAELYAVQDKRGLRRLVKQTSFLNTLIAFPLLVAIVLFPQGLLGIFGQEFTQGHWALIVLAGAQFFNSFSGSTIHLLNMTGKEQMARNITIFSALLNILLNYLLIPKYGILGAALATAISTVFWNLLAVVAIYFYHGFLTYPVLPLNQLHGFKDKLFK